MNKSFQEDEKNEIEKAVKVVKKLLMKRVVKILGNRRDKLFAKKLIKALKDRRSLCCNAKLVYRKCCQRSFCGKCFKNPFPMNLMRKPPRQKEEAMQNK